jgi:hypothetical protein
MDHEHVRVAVRSTRPGFELVPATREGSGCWRLIRTPLYATEVAAGDVIRMIDSEKGTFEIIKRGGNISVQFYLGAHSADDVRATEKVAEEIEADLATMGGRVDGTTAGLVVFSIPCEVGFAAIEKIFQAASSHYVDSQWQYGNVYDPVTLAPLLWWQKEAP